MQRPKRSQEARNKASTLKNWVEVEQHLTEVERVEGFARAWDKRERLELGKTTLDELKGRRHACGL